jgi:hypothetical protein
VPHIQTVSVCVPIENDDRVFRIERGTVVVKYMVVKYIAVSDSDFELVNVSSEVELWVFPLLAAAAAAAAAG